MPTIVRRLEQDRIEVLFERPILEDSTRGQALLQLAQKPGAHIIRGPGGITGVEAPQRDYMAFLREVDASRDEIRNVLAALDDSKKARRERMRG